MGNCCTTNPGPEILIQSDIVNARLTRQQQMAEFDDINPASDRQDDKEIEN